VVVPFTVEQVNPSGQKVVGYDSPSVKQVINGGQSRQNEISLAPHLSLYFPIGQLVPFYAPLGQYFPGGHCYPVIPPSSGFGY